MATEHALADRRQRAERIDGKLARDWARWTIWAFIAFALSIVVFLIVVSKGVAAPSPKWIFVGSLAYAITCASLSLGFLALFVRFATRRYRIFDSLSDNEYGMYLIHYAFVSWLQFAILSLAMPAIGKGLIVFAGTLLLSWGASAALRRIPGVSGVV